MKKLFILTIFFISNIIVAQPNYLIDSIVVKTSHDTVYVWDYNAWEQCAFRLDYSVEIIDSIITISQVDTAADMTTCYGYHNFVIPIVGLSEGKYRIDLYRDCLYKDNRFIKSFRFEYVINSINNREEFQTQFLLHNAYPNPFNPTTKISYSLPEACHVTLKVYDMLGREIKTLVNGNRSSGNYEIDFNASNLASGTYIYRMIAGNYQASKKLIVIK